VGAEVKLQLRWWILVPALALMANATAQDRELFAEGARASLEERFGGEDLSWIVLDAQGSLVAERWEDAERPIAPGSLLKPFVALAYGEQHGGVFPHEHCAGTSGRCWYPAGHGRLGFEEALAQSCNAYFLALVSDVDVDRARSRWKQLGLAGPPRSAGAATLIGLEDGWVETPVALARAYLTLLREAPAGVRERIVAGMRAAAMRGTARGVDRALGDRAALAKTGTAKCSHRKRATADGFALVLYPAAQPRLLLLVRKHGATGAETSTEAGAMLRTIGMGEP
jgi:cell division protein FtsI/penicillin-binding protein 2